MRNRMSFTLGLAITLALTLAAAASAESIRKPFVSAKAAPFLRTQTFAVSGLYSGVLGGNIVLEGVNYRIAPTASFYEIGSGPMPSGVEVQDRYVTLSGLRLFGSSLVFAVSVRPAKESIPDSSDPSTHVHERDASAPQ